MSALSYRIVLNYSTPEQVRLALEMFRATAPDRFELTIMEGAERVVWTEAGNVLHRPALKP